MPYVKIVTSKDGIRTYYYLAENKRVGNTVQTKILRALTPEEAKSYRGAKETPIETLKETKEIDTHLLKKMIPVFAKTRIKMVLEDAEQARIRELAQEVM